MTAETIKPINYINDKDSMQSIINKPCIPNDTAAKLSEVNYLMHQLFDIPANVKQRNCFITIISQHKNHVMTIPVKNWKIKQNTVNIQTEASDQCLRSYIVVNNRWWSNSSQLCGSSIISIKPDCQKKKICENRSDLRVVTA